MNRKGNNEIFGLLQNSITDYEEPSGIEIAEGYFFNMKDTINKIELYRASIFKSGDRDSQGDKKYFFNIVNPQCGHATKNIDLDRKDVRIKADNGSHRIQAMIYNEELKNWMREHSIGYLFNKISEELPKYGSVVLKKVKDEIKFIPLRYLMFDSAVNNKQNNYNIQSDYLIEIHYFQPDELRKMVTKGWDKKIVDELIEEMRKNKNNDIKVFEFYSEMPNNEIGKKGKGYSLGVAYVSIINVKNSKGQIEKVGKILFSKAVGKIPYKKIDYLTIEGRALGLGVIEMLFDSQQRWNEMANQKSKSMKLSSKHIFQTRDSAVEGNILTDVLDGDILKVNSEITPLANEERNLAAYAQEENNIMNLVRSNANAFEIITGESMPSRTPFRLGVLMNRNAGKLFDFIRENVGMFLEEVITEWILPQFDKEIIKEHIFEIYDRKVIREIVNRDVNRRINMAIKKIVLATGNYPTKEEVDVLKEHLITKAGDDVKFVKIIDNYLNFGKTIYLDITGEKVDTPQKVETISNMLMLLAQNPLIMQDKRLRDMLESLMEEVGISPNIYSGSEGGATQPPLNELAKGGMAGAGAGAGAGASPMMK